MAVGVMPSQREIALARANEVRFNISTVRRQLADAPTMQEAKRRLADAIESNDPDISSARLHWMLTSCHRVGNYVARRILTEAELSTRWSTDERRIRDLHPEQIARLLKVLRSA